MKLAITGGTGFVGSHLIDAALAAGHEVTALTRRDQSGRPLLTWVGGDLGDRAALDRLVAGAEAVIHVAGVINAADAAGFEHGNVAGTRAMLGAATAAGVRRFVHVSSLAAREPGLSQYGASKARAEERVQSSGLDWSIVRPPAVYGPGDKEMLELFKMARLGLMLMPPAGRVSVIHAGDLARLLLAFADAAAPPRTIVEPDDGRAGGWTHGELLRAIGRAIGRSPRVVPIPGPLLRLAARADRLVRGANARLTPDRVGYFLHHDWVVDPDLVPAPALWRPCIETRQGLAATAQWYRRQGWL